MARAERLALPVITASLLLASITASSAQPVPDKRRAVAVVEFRSGSSAAPELASRIARRLTVLTGLAILAPNAARQQLEGLDAKISACAGTARCVARLGARLGVDEVLLVGLSELGDVIVTLQRVDVATTTIKARFAETLKTGVTPTAAAVDGFLRAVLPASDFEQFGRIRVESNVESATVRVDERAVGVTPLAPVVVKAPGSYQVEVAKSGYTRFRARIAVTPNALVVVTPELSRRQSDAWYKKWWVLTIAGAVTVGAISTTLVLTQGSDRVPVMVEPF